MNAFLSGIVIPGQIIGSPFGAVGLVDLSAELGVLTSLSCILPHRGEENYECFSFGDCHPRPNNR